MRPGLATALAVTVAALSAIGAPRAARCQELPGMVQAGPGEARHVTVTWTRAPILDVLEAFAAYSGKSIVAAKGVTGTVTADIHDEPWDVALRAILDTHGLVAHEDAFGLILVERVADGDADEGVEPVVTRAYRISFSRASEIRAAIEPLLSARGRVSVVESTNTVIVTDVARVQSAVAALLR